MVVAVAPRRRFCLGLVKPTHCCDDGYPITWFRSAIPSNSLACVYGEAGAQFVAQEARLEKIRHGQAA